MSLSECLAEHNAYKSPDSSEYLVIRIAFLVRLNSTIKLDNTQTFIMSATPSSCNLSDTLAQLEGQGIDTTHFPFYFPAKETVQSGNNVEEDRSLSLVEQIEGAVKRGERRHGCVMGERIRWVNAP